MKKIILLSAIMASISLNAKIINYPGTFNGTVSGGVVSGRCVTSTSTCWSYNTDTRVLTIYIPASITLTNATEPVLDGEGNWVATYEE